MSLPFLMGLSVGHLYVKYEEKCKRDEEINELFASINSDYKGE